jgi:O-antigen/teichoic acid export membrane protein
MSAFTRIASGSIATWSRIAVNLVAQLALVPVYLSFWPADTYGLWLALQAFCALSTIYGMAHLTFLENEFVRIGASDIRAVSRTFWSSVPVAILIAIVQIVIVLAVIRTGLFGWLLGTGGAALKFLESDAAWIAVAQLLSWLLVIPVSLCLRMLLGIGHFSRFTWWGLPYVIFLAIVPLLVLSAGGSFRVVGLSQVATTLIFNLLWVFDAVRMARRSGILFEMPDIRVGLKFLHSSIYVLLRQFLEMVRQSGFRLAMLPLVGPTKLAELSTQRTIGNTAFQCMNSVYAPLLPELMRYVRERKQQHIEAAFSMLWILLVLLLCPGTVLLQTVMPAIFPWWTRHAFAYDAVLLSMLSASVLVNMASLPAVAVCSGNNLVAAQLKIALLAAIVLFVSLVPLTHVFGIRGAAAALLLCEIVASVNYVYVCSEWLGSVDLRWPIRSFRLCLIAVLQTAVISMMIAVWPRALVAWCAIYALSMVFVGYRLWHATPHDARIYLGERLRELSPVARYE